MQVPHYSFTVTACVPVLLLALALALALALVLVVKEASRTPQTYMAPGVPDRSPVITGSGRQRSLFVFHHCVCPARSICPTSLSLNS